MGLQMALKGKDETIFSLKHEIKILEHRIKTKVQEMSQQKKAIQATNEEGRK